MTYKDTRPEQIKEVFKSFGMTVNNIEQIHPNGEYSVETDTVHHNVIYTGGFHNQIIDYLKEQGLYMSVWVVYSDHIAYHIRTWRD